MSLFRAKIVCVSQLELSHHDHDQIHHWHFQVQVQLEVSSCPFKSVAFRPRLPSR